MMLFTTDIKPNNSPYIVADLYYFRELMLTLFLMNNNIINNITNNSFKFANKESGLVRYGYMESGPHIGFEYLYDHHIDDKTFKNKLANNIISQLINIVNNTDINEYEDLYNKIRSMTSEQLYSFVCNALDCLDMSTDNVSYYRIMIT